MAFGIRFVNMAIAPNYIVCKIGLEAKRYGIEKFIINITNLVAHYNNYYIRVDWPRECSIAFDVETKLEPLMLGTSNTSTIIENELEMRKLWPPKVKGVNNSKKKTTL
jgi:hypothetical protein